jgi:hypothetical protein
LRCGASCGATFMSDFITSTIPLRKVGDSDSKGDSLVEQPPSLPQDQTKHTCLRNTSQATKHPLELF